MTTYLRIVQFQAMNTEDFYISCFIDLAGSGTVAGGSR